MLTRKIEILVGLFLLAGLAALLVLVFKVANVDLNNGENSYSLEARFTNIGGLKVRSPVKVGGVVVGRVTAITLDAERLEPIVTIKIDNKYNQFPDTSSVAILTSGLLGEQFLGLTPGFVDSEVSMLANGDRIDDTRGALVLEDLIGQFLYSKSDK
ncbi:MAG: outer membrane lipid asymmetry maintenance protein MlaD [Shewanella sp.]